MKCGLNANRLPRCLDWHIWPAKMSTISFLSFVSPFTHDKIDPLPTWKLHGLGSVTRGPAGTSMVNQDEKRCGSFSVFAFLVQHCTVSFLYLHNLLSVGCLEHQIFQVFPECIRLESIDSWCHEAECSHSIHIFFICSMFTSIKVEMWVPLESTLAVCSLNIPPPDALYH